MTTWILISLLWDAHVYSIRGNYCIISTWANPTMSQWWNVLCFTEKVAIKILDKTKLDQKTQRLLSREISSMERLHHPNVIRLYEVVETLAKLHIIMEYANGGELFTKISNDGRLPESEAKVLFAQIVAAVNHMVMSAFISHSVCSLHFILFSKLQVYFAHASHLFHYRCWLFTHVCKSW